MLDVTKPSLLDLINWLKTKDPTETYVYFSTKSCLAAQYFGSINQEYHPVVADRYNHGTIYQKIEYIAVQQPWTFGAALERAENLYAEA